jgi:subtilisin family serine protease
MKNIVFAIVMVMSLSVMAQRNTVNMNNITPSTKASMETRALMQALGSAKSISVLPSTMRTLYPVSIQKGVETIGVLAKVDNTFDAKSIYVLGGNVGGRMGNIVSIHLPLGALQQLSQVAGIINFSVAHWAAPMMDNTRFDMRADSVHQGLGLPQAYDGTGVLIGITDWGFDYTHPNLNKKKNPRIERAWDQYKLKGPAPSGFTYGTEIIGYDSLMAVGGDTSNIYSYGTHGTHVAGITGGNGVHDSIYRGMAPGAHWLLGSWLLDDASWIDEVYWMWQVAKEENKRLVVNSSWGMYSFSNLNGTSLLSQAINSLSDSGVVFCTSAGNNGDTRFHIKKIFTSDTDTLKTLPSWYSYNTAIGEVIILWGTPAENGHSHPFNIRFGMARNDGEIYWSQWVNSNDNSNILSGLLPLANTDTCHWNVMCETANANDGRPHIQLNVNSVPGYTLHLWITSDSGSRVDGWNVVNLQNHAGNMGADFVNNGLTGYTMGDYSYGVGEPGCAAKTLTIAAHRADYMSNNTYHAGGLATFSSHGPAYGEYTKPEVSAPGSYVVSSISSRTTEIIQDVTATVVAGGKPYKWAPLSGTSMSSPAVAGMVALMLQANPNLSVDQIRNIVFSTARNDEMTGTIHANGTPSVTWGWGKADALDAVAAAINLLDIEVAQQNMPQLILYPNPAKDCLTLVTSDLEPEAMTIFSSIGHEVMSRPVRNGETIQLNSLSRGIYIVRMMSKLGVRTQKLVIK